MTKMRFENIRRKLKSRMAYSLSEMLIAVLIMALVSTIVATGAPAAINAYNKVDRASVAQLALTSAVTTLRKELGRSTSAKVTGVNKATLKSSTAGNVREIWFTSSETVYSTQIYQTDDDGIMIKKFIGRSTQPDPIRLVNSSITGEDLKVRYENLAISKGVITITGLKVVDADGNDVEKLDTLIIRTVY